MATGSRLEEPGIRVSRQSAGAGGRFGDRRCPGGAFGTRIRRDWLGRRHGHGSVAAGAEAQGVGEAPVARASGERNGVDDRCVHASFAVQALEGSVSLVDPSRACGCRRAQVEEHRVPQRALDLGREVGGGRLLMAIAEDRRKLFGDRVERRVTPDAGWPVRDGTRAGDAPSPQDRSRWLSLVKVLDGY